jgi:hypothetical protein
MPQRHGDTEIRRGSDRVTERQRDRETEGRERVFSPSLRLSFFLSLLLSVPLCLCSSVAGQTESFERRALSSAQEMSASELDAALPGRPFASWFSEVIGPKAGVVWQLTECGERIAAPVISGPPAERIAGEVARSGSPFYDQR